MGDGAEWSLQEPQRPQKAAEGHRGRRGPPRAAEGHRGPPRPQRATEGHPHRRACTFPYDLVTCVLGQRDPRPCDPVTALGRGQPLTARYPLVWPGLTPHGDPPGPPPSPGCACHVYTGLPVTNFMAGPSQSWGRWPRAPVPSTRTPTPPPDVAGPAHRPLTLSSLPRAPSSSRGCPGISEARVPPGGYSPNCGHRARSSGWGLSMAWGGQRVTRVARPPSGAWDGCEQRPCPEQRARSRCGLVPFPAFEGRDRRCLPCPPFRHVGHLPATLATPGHPLHMAAVSLGGRGRRAL